MPAESSEGPAQGMGGVPFGAEEPQRILLGRAGCEWCFGGTLLLGVRCAGMRGGSRGSGLRPGHGVGRTGHKAQKGVLTWGAGGGYGDRRLWREKRGRPQVKGIHVLNL